MQMHLVGRCGRDPRPLVDLEMEGWRLGRQVLGCPRQLGAMWWYLLGAGIHGQMHTPAAGARARDWADQGALTAEQPPITCGSGLVLPHHIPSSQRGLCAPQQKMFAWPCDEHGISAVLAAGFHWGHASHRVEIAGRGPGPWAWPAEPASHGFSSLVPWKRSMRRGRFRTCSIMCI